MSMDKIAQERIKELGEYLEAETSRLVFMSEERDEWKARCSVLEAQLWNLKNDRHYEVG